MFRRGDAKSLALIAGAGALGLFATVFVVSAVRWANSPLFSSPPPPPPLHVERIVVPPTPQASRLFRARERQLHVRDRHHTIIISGTASRIEGAVGVPEGTRPSPIIYVDGVRVDGSFENLGLGPDNIDRIEVLKGDKAKEQYGTEAANGVIQIFTKNAADAEGEGEEQGRR